MYVLLPMPLLFFAGSDSSSLFTESDSGYVFVYSTISSSRHSSFVCLQTKKHLSYIFYWMMSTQVGECNQVLDWSFRYWQYCNPSNIEACWCHRLGSPSIGAILVHCLSNVHYVLCKDARWRRVQNAVMNLSTRCYVWFRVLNFVLSFIVGGREHIQFVVVFGEFF